MDGYWSRGFYKLCVFCWLQLGLSVWQNVPSSFPEVYGLSWRVPDRTAFPQFSPNGGERGHNGVTAAIDGIRSSHAPQGAR